MSQIQWNDLNAERFWKRKNVFILINKNGNEFTFDRL